MKVTANMATMPGREQQLSQTIESIYNQFDKIRVVCNNMTTPPECLGRPKIEPIIGMPDMTDNGKFYGLEDLKTREIYFTVDDDILYPPNYVIETIKKLKRYHSIITWHGRILREMNANYYHGHDFFHCAHSNDHDRFIDVCGTGVTAFDTAFFHPKGLAFHNYQRMSDVIFSHEAAKQNRPIVLGTKPPGWIIPQVVTESIYQTEVKTNQINQIRLCNEVLKLKLNR